MVRLNSKAKVIGWILMSLLVVAVIMEGTYQLVGNGVLGKTICTAGLIVAVPLLLLPLVRRRSDDENNGEGKRSG